ncbi:MAG: hypothetical protein WCJ64_02175 [Rhodospirillaceae bacterium]
MKPIYRQILLQMTDTEWHTAREITAKLGAKLQVIGPTMAVLYDKKLVAKTADDKANYWAITSHGIAALQESDD